MDDSCFLIRELVRSIEREGVPPVPFIGQAGYRFHNPPAPHLEICFIESGACPDLRIGDRPHPLQAGQTTIHSVSEGNYSGAHESMTGWCLFYDLRDRPDILALAADTGPIVLDIAEQPDLVASFERLTRVLYRLGQGSHGYLAPEPLYHPDHAAGRPGAACLLKASALDLLGRLWTDVTRNPDRDARPGSGAVRQVIQAMRMQYHRPELGLPELARAVCLSPNHLGRIFREEVGVPPMHYLQHLRLQHARELLAHTDLRVNEVALLVGYRDPLYFSRLFQHAHLASPRRYRDQLRLKT